MFNQLEKAEEQYEAKMKKWIIEEVAPAIQKETVRQVAEALTSDKSPGWLWRKIQQEQGRGK